MSPQNFSVSVVRPQDLLNLRFEFINVNFTPPQGSDPGKVSGLTQSFLIVHFQPQHIAEEAFFESSSGTTQTQDEIDAGKPPDPSFDEFPSQPGDVRALLAGNSRLVFIVPQNETIPYTLSGLLEALTRLPQNVSPIMTYQPFAGCSPWNGLLGRRPPPPPIITQPVATETAIEAPYRLVLSPDDSAQWLHAFNPVTHDDRTELWHTRMGTTRPDGESVVRAIWSPDYQLSLQPFDNLPFRMSLNARDRNELVHLTSNYYISGYFPQAVDSDRLMLTALGAWLKLRGDWVPPDAPVGPESVDTLTVEQWRHEATMARDHYVRVVYAGYLLPFGHRASLVKVTERKFFMQEDAQTPGIVAYLFQRMFIIIRERDKSFTNRDLPFRQVTFKTAVTPNLNDPNLSDIDGHGQEAFWPQINVDQQAADFQFHLVGTDWEDQEVEFTAPLIFVSKNVDGNETKITGVINHYQGITTNDNRRKRPFAGQKIAYAPQKKVGDTTLETAALTLGARKVSGKPQFLPIMAEADVDIPAVKQLLGKNAPATIQWETSYTGHSNSPTNTSIGNKGDVFAKLASSEALAFATEKAGGLVAPDIDISALSRTFGPVGGPAQSMVDGEFNPLDIFDINAVKLLGGISLGEIIKDMIFNSAASAGDKIPGLTTERDGDIFRTTYTWSLAQNELVNTGLFVPNPGATFKLSAIMETPINGGDPTFKIVGELTNFSLILLPPLDNTPEGKAVELIQLDFTAVKFTSEKDKKVDVDVNLTGIQFKGILEFVNTLSDVIPMDGFSDPPSLEIVTSPPGIKVGFSFGIPTVGIGIMTIQNISLSAGFFLPFGAEPMNFHFAFCERQQPFILTVSLFGGGGFFAMDISSLGVTMIEAALEFGASVALNLGVASGQATIMAGFYFQKSGADFILTGYFRASGSLSVLGIITISAEFYLGLTYASKGVVPHGGHLWGQASLTVKIEILFFSVSVTISVEREFAGSDPTFRQLVAPDAWAQYVDAFAAYPAV